MTRKLAVPLLLLVFGSSPLIGQIPPEVLVCPAGVQADGFIDWTKLPMAPTSGTVTATIPVSGVAGLSATFQASLVAFLPPGHANYTANSPADLSLALGINPTITFSRPVQGISVTFQATDRFGHDFKMTAYSSTGQITSPAPAPAQVDTNGWDYPTYQLSTSRLQIRSASANLVAVTFQFTGSPDETTEYDLINLRVESGSGPDPSKQIPTSGLKEWLRGDRTNFGPSVGPYNVGNVTSWPDQSGNGSDAVPPNGSLGPLRLQAGPNCTPVVSFDQFQPNQLNFNLPINGWTGMTVFLAGQSYADAGGWWENQALFWNETALWGATFFTPSQTNMFFRFGTTQVGNQPIYARPANIGGDFTVTTAIHNTNTDSLYVNGVLALRQGSKYPAISGTSPTATIGAGLNNTFFTGNIGEILIYDRALGARERALVEHYLMTKYGVQ
jgi:hypothetical protein